MDNFEKSVKLSSDIFNDPDYVSDGDEDMYIDDSEIIKRILQMDGFVIDKLNFEYVKCVLDEDEEKLKYVEFVQLF